MCIIAMSHLLCNLAAILLSIFTLIPSRHLSKYKSDIPFEEKQLKPPEVKPSLARTKTGYLWYAEHRTFGTTWIRLYFCITKGILVSPDVSVCV